MNNIEDLEEDFKILRSKMLLLRRSVELFIVWIAQSANSPISSSEASELLKIISAADKDT